MWLVLVGRKVGSSQSNATVKTLSLICMASWALGFSSNPNRNLVAGSSIIDGLRWVSQLAWGVSDVKLESDRQP